MVIYLAGLQDVPKELHEAASIDGANAWSRFWKITLPLLTPSILFNLIFGMIMTFQSFTNVYIATNGGPLDSTLFYVLYLYQKAFSLLGDGLCLCPGLDPLPDGSGFDIDHLQDQRKMGILSGGDRLI